MVWNPCIHGGWLHRGRQLVCGCRLHDRLPLLPIAYGAAVITVHGLTAVLGLFINDNQWALAVLPVILIAPHVGISLKRQRNFFYWFYPAHLVVMILAREAIGIY